MIVEKLQEAFPSEILNHHENLGDPTVVVKKDRIHDILSFLKTDPELAFDMLISVTAADYLPKGEKPRFEAVYHLYSIPKNHRLRLRVKVPEEDPVLPTATDLWKAADWFEREVYDFFGFRFTGHPNLRRLLLNDNFVGHPLRKDYPIDLRQKIPVPEEKL